jgi:hypothetical protein
MGILPSDFYNGNVSTTTNITDNTTPNLLIDYVIDLTTGYPIVSDSGQFIVCNGLKAVVMQMWRKLHVVKKEFIIYSSKYGNTFIELKGKGKSYADLYAYQKLVDSIVDNIYILSVSNFSTSLDKDKFTMGFTANTIYGDTSQVLQIELE